MAEKTTVTVANVAIPLVDNDAEGVYPTPRAMWPTVAHAPSALGFTRSDATFKSLIEANRRATFAQMAHSLAGLGKGSRVNIGGTTQIFKDADGKPARSIAYGDAVMMGERATKRSGMFATGVEASSCGMLVRSLLMMIGVTTPGAPAGIDVAREYTWGKVFELLDWLSNTNGKAARVNPGDSEPLLAPDGTPVLENGQAKTATKMPKLGDVVIIWHGGGSEAHTFVITSAPDLAVHGGYVERTVPSGGVRRFWSTWYSVAQGGQCLTTQFPDDGSCMGANEVSHSLDAADWIWDGRGGGAERRVGYWIDINKLGDACDDGALIMPARRISW